MYSLYKKEADRKLKKTRIDSIKILDNSDWREFNDSYTCTYHDISSNSRTEGMRYGEEKTEIVEMSKGRPSS